MDQRVRAEPLGRAGERRRIEQVDGMVREARIGQAGVAPAQASDAPALAQQPGRNGSPDAGADTGDDGVAAPAGHLIHSLPLCPAVPDLLGRAALTAREAQG
jgi:hypothetical protein